MANKQLRADIIVGGRADSSLIALGNQIAAIGNILNPISGRLMEFGKESVRAFVSYEDAMLDAQVALRSQYSSASELSKVMRTLDESALQWANDSRFSTEDVAGAISKAAHAGWDLEKMLGGVPAAMKLSLAGSMDLSQGLEYMVDISNAAGLSFQELGDLTDYWAYAANRSSTTVPEMGEAMQKMGATLQFVKGDMAGLTTMLSVLADNGTKGTAAGTLLRNTMLRLIAPTKAAANAMDGLNLTADDLDEIYSDSSGLEEANQYLQDMGFSAYDAQGNLKSFLDIFTELNAATKGMTEEDRNNLLSSIFPTRTITGALALLDAADEKWNGLYEDVQTTGKGYADYAAETMESGLGGTLRHLDSVYNTLQTHVGETLSGPVSTGAKILTGLIESVNGMNDTAFAALTDSMGALALAGPALTGIGMSMKFLPMLGAAVSNPVGIAAMLGIAGTAFAAFASQMYKLDLENAYGSMELDPAKVNGWLNAVDENFKETTKDITKYSEAGVAAVDRYSKAAETLQETAITSMMTGKTLTNADKVALSKLGDEMRREMLNAIYSNKSASESAAAMFGDGSGLWKDISDTMEYGFREAITKAETLSTQLRNALASAFADGSLNADEIINIQSIIDQQNELIAMQTEAKNATERAKLLHDAQTLGMDGINQITAQVAERREAQLATVDDAYWQLYSNLYTGGLSKIKSGALNANGQKYSMSDLEAELAGAEANWQRQRSATSSAFDKNLIDAYMTMGGTSDFAETWAMLAGLGDQAVSTGGYSQEDFTKFFGQNLGDRKKAVDLLSKAVGSMGGLDSVLGQADYLASIGDSAAADFYKLANMYSIGGGALNMTPAEAGNLTQTVSVNADTSGAQSAIDSLGGQTVYVNVVGITSGGFGGGGLPAGAAGSAPGKFAEGGRADEPSIFGEAGAEWAIPEAHTPRTAQLLMDAAAASGFSWTDLLSIGASRSSGNTLVYSPTIVANDANGVESKLMADKNRLEKYLKEKKWIDSVEVYQ